MFPFDSEFGHFWFHMFFSCYSLCWVLKIDTMMSLIIFMLSSSSLQTGASHCFLCVCLLAPVDYIYLKRRIKHSGWLTSAWFLFLKYKYNNILFWWPRTSPCPGVWETTAILHYVSDQLSLICSDVCNQIDFGWMCWPISATETHGFTILEKKNHSITVGNLLAC